MIYPCGLTCSNDEQRWIHLHVKSVAEEIVEYAQRNAQAVLGDPKSALPIMDFAIALVSRYLLIQRLPLSRGRTKNLLRTSFRRRLQRDAARVNCREMWGGCNDVEEAILAYINAGQTLSVALDSSRIIQLLSQRARRVLALRDLGYSWKEIAWLLESQEFRVRRALRDELRLAIEIADHCESRYIERHLASLQRDGLQVAVIRINRSHEDQPR